MRRAALEWLPYVPLALLLLWLPGLRPQGDTVALVTGAENALDCLARGRIPCDRNVVHFAPFQYLFALPALLLGVKAALVPKLIAGINGLFAVAAAAIFYRTGMRLHGARGAHAALALLFTSYALYYFTSSFGEIASFTLFAGFAAAVCFRKHALAVGVLAFLCCITKETAPPFVLLAFAGARLAGAGRGAPLAWGELRPGLAATLAGIALGVAANIAFNGFRFGAWTNVALLNPLFQAPPSAVTAYFAYLFLSPAGGLAYAWLSACAFALAAAFAARTDDRALLVVAVAVALVLATNLGLAFWWSSFGWYAWGPRLTLPVMGAAVILVLAASGPLLHRLADPRGRLVALAIVFAILFASALPNVLALLFADDYFVRMFAPNTINRLVGPDAVIIEKGGPEVLKLGAMESYGRPVLVPTTLELARKHPIVTALCAAYAALAAWAICRTRR